MAPRGHPTGRAAGADTEPVLAGRHLHDEIARYHANRATASPPVATE